MPKCVRRAFTMGRVRAFRTMSVLWIFDYFFSICRAMHEQNVCSLFGDDAPATQSEWTDGRCSTQNWGNERCNRLPKWVQFSDGEMRSEMQSEKRFVLVSWFACIGVPANANAWTRHVLFCIFPNLFEHFKWISASWIWISKNLSSPLRLGSALLALCAGSSTDEIVLGVNTFSSFDITTFCSCCVGSRWLCAAPAG